MKKLVIFAVTAFLAMIAGVGMDAQTISTTRFGVFGGYTSSKATGSKSELADFTTGKMPLYQAGITAEFPITASFFLQPSVAWQVKGATLTQTLGGTLPLGTYKARMGYLEGSLQLQYGPDLLLFRPYALVEPFVGVGLTAKSQVGDLTVTDISQAGLSRVEFGTGVGLGVEIWHLQVAFKWFWNFGNLYSEKNTSADEAIVAQGIKGAFEKGGNFRGFTVSLALFLF